MSSVRLRAIRSDRCLGEDALNGMKPGSTEAAADSRQKEKGQEAQPRARLKATVPTGLPGTDSSTRDKFPQIDLCLSVSLSLYARPGAHAAPSEAKGIGREPEQGKGKERTARVARLDDAYGWGV
ncbi:hypothetical protein CDD83_2956 [Cordyceps sp. RAO-2017]|nr:hypothetical protein CDD83_2956 [Cordyceps sp. RAO-2017]